MRLHQARKSIIGRRLTQRDFMLRFATELIEGGVESFGELDSERADRMSSRETTMDLASRPSDLAWRVPFRGAADQTEKLYLLAFLEFKMRIDPVMAQRLESIEARYSQSQGLRARFLEYFKLRLESLGVTWEVLDDPTEIARLAAAGELRTAMDKRVQETYAEWRAKGREEVCEEARKECLEGERRLLKRQAGQRFGPETAESLERQLAVIAEHEQLLSVGDWILACASGSELLDRVKAEF